MAKGVRTAATVVPYRAGATSRRQQLLRDFQEHVPGVKFARFDPGKPGVFTVTVEGAPEEFQLTLTQVEMFVAAFRAGYAHGAGQLGPGDLPRFATQQF